MRTSHENDTINIIPYEQQYPPRGGGGGSQYSPKNLGKRLA